MNETAERWGAVGFRSPATHRNPDWFHAMGFDYDSSAPDTDPYEPQPGGCLSLFPFLVDDVVELPITMPQDHTVFGLLKRPDGALWAEKAKWVIARNGVVCILAHPDTMTGYAESDAVMPHYSALLERLARTESRMWNPLPRNLSAWWRLRRNANIFRDAGGVRIKDGGPGMVCGTLRVKDSSLVVVPPRARMGAAQEPQEGGR